MASLPESMTALTLDQARTAGLRKDEVYRMVEAGDLERVGRGVFIRPERLDPTVAQLAAATALRPESTLCLTSALVHHDLSDEIPRAADIALPRGIRHPAGFLHVSWHSFAVATFDVGRTVLIDRPAGAPADAPLAVYSAERTIVDCFRLAHREGVDVAYAALRRWVRRPGSSPRSLLEMAATFPKTQQWIRRVLEVLL